MKKIILIIALLLPISAAAQTAAFNGYCTLGSTPAITSGSSSSNLNQGLIPQCQVTVYLTGTVNLASIYSDATNTPLTNPFTASTKAQWLFFAATGQGYDVVMNGGFPPLVYSVPVTLTDLLVGSGGGGGGSCIPSGIAGTLQASNGFGGCQPAQVEVNNAPLLTPSPVNFVDTATVTVANLANGEISLTSAQLSPETNGTPNTSQALLNFVDTTTIHFTNPSGGVESATCQNSTSSSFGCVKPDNATVTISEGILSANVTDFKHGGTLLTGAFAPNSAIQVYDYDESAIAPDSGFSVAVGRFNTGTGKFNFEVPNTPIQTFIQFPDNTHQYYIAYPTSCTADNSASFGRITAACSATGTSSSADFKQNFANSAFPPSTASTIITGWSLPAGITAGQVTAIYAAAVSSTDSFGQAFTSRTCSGSNVLPSTNSWPQQQVTALTGLTGATIGTAACSFVASNSGTQSAPVETRINAIVLLIQYTGAFIPNSTDLNVIWPISLNTATNSLGIDQTFPSWLNGITVAQLNSLSAGVFNPTPGAVGYYSLVYIRDGISGSDCIVGGGTNRVLCYFDSGTSLWTAFSGGGGGGGDTITSPGGTLAVGGTSTNTTLDLALGHANTWTAKQTQPAPIFSDITGSTQCLQVNSSGQVAGTGSACGAGGGGLSGQTTGFLPLATSATASTTSSSLEDTGASLIYHGTGASRAFLIPEGTSASGVAGSDILTPDSTTHRLLQNPNNTGNTSLVGTSTTASTPGHCVQYGSNGYDIADSGSACGSGSATPLSNRISCVTYSCVADGNLAANTGTDNTTTFTNCLTAAIASKGVCYIPAGVYRIATSMPTISVGGTGFVGDTWGYTSIPGNWNGPTTTIFSSSASATILTISNASIITGDTLQNISLQRAVSPGAASVALLMNNAAGAWINRNTFGDSAVGLDLTSVPSYGLGIFEHNVAEWGFAGIGCISSGSMIGFNLHGGGGGFTSLFLQWNAVANNCGATLTSYAYKMDGAIVDLNMANNQSAGTGYGIYAVGSGARDSHIVDQTDDGNLIQCEHFDFSGGGQSLELRGGWCETGHGTSGGTELHNVRGVRVSNRQYNDQGGSLPVGVIINTGSTANAIQNNTFYQPNSVGIVCNGANSNNYSGNTFDLQGAASEALTLANCSNNVTMSNKAIAGTSTVISLDSSSNNNLWVNMNSWESSGTAVSDLGTGNQFTTPVATGSTFGTIKPDGTTCTVTTGVLTCPGSSATYSVLPAPPALATFTWVNQLTGSATQGAFSAINVILPNQGSLNWQILKTTTPSTPWSAQMYSSNVQGVATGAAGNWGMYIYDGTKLEGIENLYNGGSNCSILSPGCLRVERMNSVTSDNSTVLANTQTYGVLPQSGWYLRWCDSGTTLYAEWSMDGSVWNVLYSESVGAFITPTAVGFGGLNVDATPNNIWGSVKGWQITSGATCP